VGRSQSMKVVLIRVVIYNEDADARLVLRRQN
jgi:hypothetical protein